MTQIQKGKTFIGTSGFSYDHWANDIFYPENLPKKEWLSFYAEHFNTLELNVTFYRLPNLTTFQTWFDRTPQNFHFVLKGSRYITHQKKLHEVDESIDLFFSRTKELKYKCSAILWQLPSTFEANIERFQKFIEALKKNKNANKLRHVFEFRNDSWFKKETYSLLEENNFAICIAHSPYWKEERIKTSDFIYIRFHGGKSLYRSNYSLKELNQWARIAKKLAGNDDIYAFFNNDALGHAVNNAKQFAKLLKE